MLSWNPSSSEEDTIGARWHGEVDLEAILGWHASAYYVLCWDVLRMYLRATWVVGIPTLTIMN